MNSDEKLPDGMRIRSESIGFEPNDLVPCPKCNKSNPPSRSTCLYCGTYFESGSPEIPESMRIQTPVDVDDTADIIALSFSESSDFRTASQAISIEPSILKVLAEYPPVPIARISLAKADSITRRLTEIGFKVAAVFDRDLYLKTQPIRLGSIDFGDRTMDCISINSNSRHVVSYDDVKLIVTGVVMQSKVETVETGGRKKRKVVSESPTFQDEQIFDFYSNSDKLGFRVRVNGFDFSCLQAKHDLTAFRNMQLLVAELLARCPSSTLADKYSRILKPLSSVWPIENNEDYQGRIPIGSGTYGFSRVTRLSNLNQFTKYSRMLNYVL